MKKLILIDGNAIIHRAFHALPPFKTSNGELVNAIYGFSSMLLNILNTQKPDYIAVSFDLKGKTFRHEQYEDYKATRVKAPDELYEQIPRIREIVESFRIPIYEVEGYEADDVLGTLAAQASEKDELVSYIVTGDMDTLQLIDKNVKVLAPHKGFSGSIIYNDEKVREKYGLEPAQIADMKGLQGDASDNIKGVKGIGKITAQKLLQKYGTIENIYDHLDEIKGSVHDKLKADRENAYFSKKLATIFKKVPVKLDLHSCQTHEYDKEKVLKLFSELEFKSLIKKLDVFNSHSDRKRELDRSSQQSLF